ncbi:tyrosinase family protein [Streptomyces sp. NPDC001135]
MTPVKTRRAGIASNRFPTGEELARLAVPRGFHPALVPETLALRLDRHVAAVSGAAADARAAQPDSTEALLPVREFHDWLVQLTGSLTRTRVDHRQLCAADRDRFNQALQDLHADGRYQALAAIHSDVSHRMHSMMGSIGTQRFLPWHRVYTLKCEDLLRTRSADLTVPYWDYANDHARPDWVWQPPTVTRDRPGPPGTSLPPQAVVDALMQKRTYTSFTRGVENDAHNGVHNWCNGTISDPATAAQDPIFWLLHANVDRIWDHWQLTHTGTPTLSHQDAVLDPWLSFTATTADDITQLGYAYA